ncbi:hypothetical protein QLL95_gp0089 [Cotonvirus japonicus]|nr:hypothetical protein QLL95_gp0089 [Cotonvirus japonicus]BCS82578.1 hypothetical protein [Cotonvirus japonicus]
MNINKLSIIKYSKFLIQALEKYNCQYDYQYVNYTNNMTKIDIVCNGCKTRFTTTAKLHLKTDRGECPVCFPRRRYDKLSTEKLISLLRKKCDNDFDYSKIYFRGVKHPITLICNKCKQKFNVFPKDFLVSPKCRVCNKTKKSLTKQEFVDRAIKQFGPNKYNYSNTTYQGLMYDISVTCNNCNKNFKVKAKSHLNGRGCDCRL